MTTTKSKRLVQFGTSSAAGVRSGVAALTLAIVGASYQVVCFALSRIVESQGVPEAGDAVFSPESGWFVRLMLFGMVPFAITWVGALVSAVISIQESIRWRERLLAFGSIAVLIGGQFLWWPSFLTWAGSGW